MSFSSCTERHNKKMKIRTILSGKEEKQYQIIMRLLILHRIQYFHCQKPTKTKQKIMKITTFNYNIEFNRHIVLLLVLMVQVVVVVQEISIYL